MTAHLLVDGRRLEIPACAGMTVILVPDGAVVRDGGGVWEVPACAGITVFMVGNGAVGGCVAFALGSICLIRYASFMREATDEQLMRRYAKGNAKAFDELYARHRGPLYRYFIRQVSNPATANDLYQGAWEKMIKARKNYRPTAPFTVWMYTIAHNHLVDHYRRSQPDNQVEPDDLKDPQAGPVQGLIDSEHDAILRAGITALPQEQRNALLLKLETGLKMEDIARVTGVSRETVKSRLRYAVQKLKRSLVE